MKIRRNIDMQAEHIMLDKCVRSQIITELFKFYESDDVSMAIDFDDAKEARIRRSTIATRVRKDNLPLNVFLRGNTIYVTRKGGVR